MSEEIVNCAVHPLIWEILTDFLPRGKRRAGGVGGVGRRTGSRLTLESSGG